MEGKISFKQIITLAVPAIIAGIAEPLLSITDTAFIGNTQQNPIESLAAVGIAGSFIAAITWILAQTRSAITAIVSQFLGANKLHEIKTLPAQILVLNFLVSLFLYFITILFIEQIFRLYHANGIILDLSVKYYTIRALGLPFTLFTFSVFGVFRGLQNTFTPMVISITGMGINVILDYLLIFGIEGILPPLHIEGAAYASVIAQIIMAIMSFIYFIKKTPFNLKLSFQINPQLKRLLHLSANLFVRTLSLNIALYLANAYATQYGKNYIAAQTIAFQIWLFFAFFIDGFSSVGNIVSGKLLGEKNYKAMYLLSKSLIKYTIYIALILGSICFIFYKPIGSIFTKDPDVLQLFYSVFWIVIIMQPINAIAFIFDGIFKGLAEAVTLRNVLLAATFLGFVPTLLISDFFNLKLYGIWLAFTIWMLIRAFALQIIYKKKYLIT